MTPCGDVRRAVGLADHYIYMNIGVFAVATAFAPAAEPAAAEPPPYTLNLDQSFTCPRDVNDAWYTARGTPHAAVLPNASAELAAVIDAVPAYAAFWRSIPRLASLIC